MNKLYQIHTRDLLFKISPTARLVDIPDSFWQNLYQKGINMVYLLGVWTICSASTNLSQKIYEPTKTQKIVGSCFAIDDYIIDTNIGTDKDILALKTMLNSLGIQLILDFIPNHFGLSTSLLDTNLEVFLQNSNPNLDQQFYFKHTVNNNSKQFLYGKDPNFGSWCDTVQIDYSNPKTHVFMTQKFEYLASLCDGVRCDMAMLIESEIFQKTWSELLKKSIPTYQSFWQTTTVKIKKLYPNFVFIAEVYWNMEEQMLKNGFDFVYNKEFLDSLVHQNFDQLQDNLQKFGKPVYFLENHDEQRSTATIDSDILSLCVVLLCFLGGIQFFYDQQWQGQTTHNPIQILDSQISVINKSTETLYFELLVYTQNSIFKFGQLSFETSQSHDLVTIIWEYKNLKTYVFINFGTEYKQIIKKITHQYIEQKTYQNNQISTISKSILTQSQNLLIEIPSKNWIIVECF